MTEESDQRYELIDGVVYLLAAPGYTHQRILGALHVVFHEWFKGHESCAPFLSPFDVDLIRQPIKREREVTEDDINVVEPDLMILCDPERDVNEKDRYKGTPDLVVEILSSSTRSKDLVRKLSLYMESGIREFWVIDPDQRSITVYAFEKYEIASYTGYRRGDRAESVVYPGLAVDTETLFDTKR
jgi:Uma2 family endonuclease